LELVELDPMVVQIIILIKVAIQFFQLLQVPAVAVELLTDHELETLVDLVAEQDILVYQLVLLEEQVIHLL
tara:strand:- start:147 stop:359 length:213 start_codon:yes stop_codon:yes gene_type:complete